MVYNIKKIGNFTYIYLSITEAWEIGKERERSSYNKINKYLKIR